MLLLSIPKPCHENWNEMSPREQGAFCTVCAKTVVDFTKLSNEEIKNFFLRHQGQKTCGRFTNDQLAAPRTLHELLSRPIPFWKKFLAIVCIIFGSFLSSCQNTNVAKVKEPELKSYSEPEFKCGNSTMGMTWTDMIQDTIFREDSYPGTIKGDIGVEIIDRGVIEPQGIMPIEEPEMVFTGQLKADTVEKIHSPLPKVDSAKINTLLNNCDTIPMKPIEL